VFVCVITSKNQLSRQLVPSSCFANTTQAHQRTKQHARIVNIWFEHKRRVPAVFQTLKEDWNPLFWERLKYLQEVPSLPSAVFLAISCGRQHHLENIISILVVTGLQTASTTLKKKCPELTNR
jgi:hypothetical protein